MVSVAAFKTIISQRRRHISDHLTLGKAYCLCPRTWPSPAGYCYICCQSHTPSESESVGKQTKNLVTHRGPLLHFL